MNAGRNTPLMEAANYGNHALVKYLISAGADVNRMNFQGQHVLLLAVNRASPSCVKVLLEAGANVNHESSHGVSALDVCLDGTPDRMDILKLLAPHKPRVTSHMWLSIINRDCMHLIQPLIEAGADVNMVDASGVSILEHAVRAHSEAVVESLLAAGARVTPRGAEMFAAAHRSGGRANLGIMKMLLRHGVEVGAEGDTSLDNEDWLVADMLAFAAGANIDPLTLRLPILHRSIMRFQPVRLGSKPDMDASRPLVEEDGDDLDLEGVLPRGNYVVHRLQAACRTVIRRVLMSRDRVNLFVMVPMLPVPIATRKFLLHGQSVD